MKDIAFVCLLAAIVVRDANAHWIDSLAFSDDPKHDDHDNNPCLTDKASCGCCMQKQMHNMDSSFNQSLNDLEANLKQVQHVLANRSAFSVQALTNEVSCFGDPSLPSTTTHAADRSVFSVALTNEESLYCYGEFRKVVVVFYEHEFINQGDVYNRSTGEFTVPRSGVYSLALTSTVQYSNAGTRAGVSMIVNNVMQYQDHTCSGISGTNKQTAHTVLAMELNAGDKVSVIMHIGYRLCDSNSHFQQNTFSGFLLYANATDWK